MIFSKRKEEDFQTPDFEDLDQISEITELSKKGYQYLKENLFSEAEQCFDEIISKSKENNYALVGLGDLARKRRKFQEAIGYYQKCLLQYPENNYALFGLADSYKSLRQFDKAIDIWEKYLNHDPENVTVLTRVADAYRKIKDFKKSKEVYFSVLEKDSDNPYALIGLGHLHYDFREYQDALRFWERMYDLHQDNIDIRVLTSIGNCHRKLKTFEKGLGYFNKALALDPVNFYALFGMADCHRGLNEHEDSLRYWLRILENDTLNKVILTRAGDAYRNMQDYENAKDYYKRALDLEYDAYATLGLALISKEQKEYDQAIESLKHLIRSDSKNHRFYTELAECFWMKGDKDAALSVLNDFQKLGIRNLYVINLYSKIKNS